MLRGRHLQRLQRHAGFHHRNTLDGAEMQDAIEPGGGKNQFARFRQTAAHEPGSTAMRDERHAVGAAASDNGGNFPGRAGEDDGAGVELSSTSRWSHLYTGELLERRALAVEPTTCPPDAFNSGEDLDVLAPGQAVALTCRIAAVG